MLVPKNARRLPTFDQHVLALYARGLSRRILTTTNAIESLHSRLRRILKTRGHLPTDEAATKLLYLALRDIKKRWGPAPVWVQAITHFALLFPDRFVPEPRDG